MPSPPLTDIDLLTRVNDIAGKTLGEIASACGVIVPSNQKKQKGWVGQLMEMVLGANAGCLAKPDFSQLKIELKTLPLGENGKPCESTFVASISLLSILNESWQNSTVKCKLNKVLWLPIEATKTIPLPMRRIGQGFLWQANKKQEAILKADWQELVDMIALGELEKIDARIGRYMQVRPKAATGRSLRLAVAESGEYKKTLPRGFYLRPSFTNTILNEQMLAMLTIDSHV